MKEGPESSAGRRGPRRLLTGLRSFTPAHKLIVAGAFLMAVGVVYLLASPYYGASTTWLLSIIGGLLVASAAVERLLERDP